MGRAVMLAPTGGQLSSKRSAGGLMYKKMLTWLLTLVVIGLSGFFALAWRSGIAPVTPPAPGSFPPELVAKGEALSGAGFCAECHTRKDGEKFTGGYALNTAVNLPEPTNLIQVILRGISAKDGLANVVMP